MLPLQAYQFVADTGASATSSFKMCSRSIDMPVPRHFVATFTPILHQTPPENLYYGICLYFGPVKRPSITRGYSDYYLNNPHSVMLPNVWVFHAYVS